MLRDLHLPSRWVRHGLLLAWLLQVSARAAAPVLDHVFPAAIQVGTTNLVSAVGKFDPWPAKVWIDAPGIVFKAETNSGKFSVEVAADAPVGPHLVRLYNDQGASALRFIIVTKEPQTPEAEPNDDFKKPQRIEAITASINGRLEKSGDVDSYAFALQAGQSIVAAVDAYTLASPVDAVLRVVDSRGVQLEWNHDCGLTLDPFLAWTAKTAGTYVVQVFGFAYPAGSEVKFTGSDKCVYRLHLSRGPYLKYTLPLGVQRGAKTKLELKGWNFPVQESFEFDGMGLATNAMEASIVRPGIDNALQVPVGEGPERLEREPNDSVVETNGVATPFGMTGAIDRIGDIDRFTFTAKKDQKLLVEIQSAALGCPLDAWVKIENSTGKELAKNEGSTGVDPKLEWTAPEDGTFVVAVGNRLQRGGADYRYHLVVEPARPGLRATLPESSIAIAPGKTNDLKIALKRLHGFRSELKVSVNGLPTGLSAEPVTVAEKDSEAVLKLIATADAKPWSGPVQVTVAETGTNRQHRAVADLTSSTVNNGVPGGFIQLAVEATDQLWLTVQPVPPPKVETKK